MKRRVGSHFIPVVVALLAMTTTSYAQNQAATPQQPEHEKILKDMLNEIHQLRVALERLNLNAYRAQIIVERLRLQQGQVTRLADELAGVRRQLGEVRSALAGLKERSEKAEERQEAGLISEAEVKDLKAAIADHQRREQELTDRENRLSGDLLVERGNLDELNRRLDELEAEIKNSAPK